MNFNEINGFLASQRFQDFWLYSNMAIFWISVLFLPFVLWMFISLVMRLRKTKKRLEKDIYEPGMEHIRRFYKKNLEDIGIKVEEKDNR